MIIVLVSDSHGYSRAVTAALNCVGDFDAVFHMGDGCRDLARIIPLYPKAKFYAVPGNCDAGGAVLSGKGVEDELLLDMGFGAMLLAHGHLYGVKSNRERFASSCASKGAVLGIYGHTHIAKIERVKGVTLVCPGSCAFPNGSRYPTYGVINIKDGGVFDVFLAEITPYGGRPV